MPKQELKILEFHGGTNNKFDPRDIANNQNAVSRLSIRRPGRLVCEGDGKTLYTDAGTSLNGHTITNITASGGFEDGYGLHAFSHDFDMRRVNIVQNGDDFASNWADRDVGGNDDGWNINSGSSGLAEFQYSDGEDASLINTLGGDAIDGGKTYELIFEVGTASLNLLIGGANQNTGSSPDDTYIAASNYAVGTHSVTFTAVSDRSHLWLKADQSASAGAGTIDNVSCYRLYDETATDFVIINDGSDIDIYDSTMETWNAGKFSLGSRAATVKPNYYNVDGGLRVCDSNFDGEKFDTETLDMTGDADMTKNDVNIKHVTGTIATGSIIRIDGEIMYVTSGSGGTTDITVIRGFANTTIATHKHGSLIWKVNVPRYFGHIKADRMFEAATSDSVNDWALDVQSPQPPNNTRTGALESPHLASSGVQSLRVLNDVSGATQNFPDESEKVVLEIGEGPGNVGIKQISTSYGQQYVYLTTSGYANNASAHCKLKQGDTIIISKIQSDEDWTSGVEGQHYIFSVNDTGTVITIMVNSATLVASNINFNSAVYSRTINDWVTSDDTENAVQLEVDTGSGSSSRYVTDLELTAGNSYPIHITGEASVPSYNGIYDGTIVDDDSIYISHGEASSFATGSHSTANIQLLVGVIHLQDSEAISDDLKRNWNFAMSFTYDGPAQEVQESLLTAGYTVQASIRADNGDINKIAGSMNDSDSSTTVAVSDGDGVFEVNDVVMVGTEQMLVTGVASNNVTFTRGYNGTTKTTHSSGDEIFEIKELTSSHGIDMRTYTGVPDVAIKFLYKYKGSNTSTWNPRINGFKIYMKDVSDEDSSDEWKLFSKVNFNKGTYQIFAASDEELILEQNSSWSSNYMISTLTSGTKLTMQPFHTYESENLFSAETLIDAKYKVSELVGRRVYIGNVVQGMRTYPDRLLRSNINKFDTFPETNFIDVAVGDGDEITALDSFGDRLLQFKRDKLYIINISGETEILESEHPNAGVAKPHQTVKTSNGIAWINSIGLWFFDGKEVECLTRHLQLDGYADDFGVTALIAFDEKSNRVIYTPKKYAGLITTWYIYDFELKAYQSYYYGNLFPTVSSDSDSGLQYYSNFINLHRQTLLAYSSATHNTEVNFYKWSNTSAGGGDTTIDAYSLWESKDFDFGSPSIRKKIYKVYVTYKCTGHSGVKMVYGTDGSATINSAFSNSTNYDTAVGKGFLNSSGAWAVAELKPSSSINNVKSIQLAFVANPVSSSASSVAADLDTTDTVKLDSGLGTSVDYTNYILSIYDGPARYNVRRITSYTPSTQIAEVADLTDNGYGQKADDGGDSKYILGAIAPDFEINDITIVYRVKPVK